MSDTPTVGYPRSDRLVLAGPITYRGSEADAHDFLDAVQSRVATQAVRVRWVGAAAVWFDLEDAEVARVTADRPVVQKLIAAWVQRVASRGQLRVGTADND